MFPACVGFGMVARELIPLSLGRRWEGAVPPLEVLSVYAAFRSIVALLPKVLVALGYPRFVMWNDIAAIFILGAAFYTGSHWGITGIAWGWVFGYPLVVVPLYRKVFKAIDMTVPEYVRSVSPALEGTLVMVLAVFAVKRVPLNGLSLLLRLALEVLTGVLTYGAVLWFRHRERTFSFIRLAKSFRRG
jgi:O-antigen/teichoic acid export membrane protein